MNQHPSPQQLQKVAQQLAMDVSDGMDKEAIAPLIPLLARGGLALLRPALAAGFRARGAAKVMQPALSAGHKAQRYLKGVANPTTYFGPGFSPTSMAGNSFKARTMNMAGTAGRKLDQFSRTPAGYMMTGAGTLHSGQQVANAFRGNQPPQQQ